MPFIVNNHHYLRLKICPAVQHGEVEEGSNLCKLPLTSSSSNLETTNQLVEISTSILPTLPSYLETMDKQTHSLTVPIVLQTD